VAFGFFMLASIGLPGLAGFVGEFLVFQGSFVAWPLYAAIAVLVMTLGAAYLLWLYQRMFTGELSDFFRGLGDHLTDLSPVEVMTLVPLGTLVLLLGLFPGLALGVIQGPTDGVLSALHGTVTALAGTP
jgi:NADH-quinone oxidoreductase subunit M